MPIKTSSQHERFGADAIHFKIENDKPIIMTWGSQKHTQANISFLKRLKMPLLAYYQHIHLIEKSFIHIFMKIFLMMR